MKVKKPPKVDNNRNGGKIKYLADRFVKAPPLQQAVIITLFVASVYFVSAQSSSPFNQYVLLANAFLHGKVYIENPASWLELMRVRNIGYVIESPLPALLLTPLVALFGTNFNQVLAAVAIGALTSGLFWIAARRMWPDIRFCLLMTGLLSFGTNYWWASTDGSVWTFASVCSMLFLTAALVECTDKKRPWVAGLMIGLAGLSRYSTFLSIPFFAYLLIEETYPKRLNELRNTALRLLPFVAMLAVCAIASMSYNYARFGNFFATGYTNNPDIIAQSQFSQGLFSIAYIPKQLNAILFAVPKFFDYFPYIKPSIFGLGLFFTTPALLYVFSAKRNKRNTAALLSILATGSIFITWGSIGAGQFGYRFALDVMPFLLILAASGMDGKISKTAIAAVVLSIIVNAWGVLWFNKIGGL